MKSVSRNETAPYIFKDSFVSAKIVFNKQRILGAIGYVSQVCPSDRKRRHLTVETDSQFRT
jgi:hypothetical protein